MHRKLGKEHSCRGGPKSRRKGAVPRIQCRQLPEEGRPSSRPGSSFVSADSGGWFAEQKPGRICRNRGTGNGLRHYSLRQRGGGDLSGVARDAGCCSLIMKVKPGEMIIEAPQINLSIGQTRIPNHAKKMGGYTQAAPRLGRCADQIRLPLFGCVQVVDFRPSRPAG